MELTSAGSGDGGEPRQGGDVSIRRRGNVRWWRRPRVKWNSNQRLGKDKRGVGILPWGVIERELNGWSNGDCGGGGGRNRGR